MDLEFSTRIVDMCSYKEKNIRRLKVAELFGYIFPYGSLHIGTYRVISQQLLVGFPSFLVWLMYTPRVLICPSQKKGIHNL